MSRRVLPQSPIRIDGEEKAEKARRTTPYTEPPSLKHGSRVMLVKLGKKRDSSQCRF